MDCNIFKKRLNDLLEDNLSYDLRKAMLEHIKGCETCSALYKEELEIDEMFKAGLSLEMQNFRSLRSDIMKNIDKNRYGVGTGKKLIRHFKHYIATYTSLVAIIAIFVFLVPYVKTHGLIGMNKTTGMAPKSNTTQNAAMSAKSAVESDKALGIDPNGSANLPQANASNGSALDKKDNSYSPQFEKKELSKDVNAKFNTPWEFSTSKKYSATVEGKGTEAQEEGIASIMLINIGNGQKWSFNLINNEKQFTPKAVKWVDDENLLVIVGFGYGMVSRGGELYILNINTGLAAKADPQNTANLNGLSEITKIQSAKMVNANTLRVDTEVLVYEDNQMNNNHRENRTITSPFSEIANSIK